VTDNKNHLLIL